MGTVDCKTLRNGLRDGDFGDLNPQLALAAVQARDKSCKGNDPQMVDVIIARCCNVCPSLLSSTKKQILNQLVEAYIDISKHPLLCPHQAHRSGA